MNDKGYNDLEATIERLEFRNSKLHSHNEKIEQEIIELRKDKKNEPNVRQERRRTRIIC